MQTKTPYIPTRERTTAVPLGNFDVMEDGNTLVNRLYYAVPRFENGRFQCSVFYEENTFCKDADGDRKSTRLNSSHKHRSRMPSSA